MRLPRELWIKILEIKTKAAIVDHLKRKLQFPKEQYSQRYELDRRTQHHSWYISRHDSCHYRKENGIWVRSHEHFRTLEHSYKAYKVSIHWNEGKCVLTVEQHFVAGRVQFPLVSSLDL